MVDVYIRIDNLNDSYMRWKYDESKAQKKIILTKKKNTLIFGLWLRKCTNESTIKTRSG